MVSNLETGEPLWFGQDRKQETLDEFFREELSGLRGRIAAACVDMWEPFTTSILSWAPECRIVYDKFHVMQHASKAVDEVRRAEFFRKGGRMRGLVKGKRWLLLSRWVNLDGKKRQLLNELFRLNRRMMKAYLLKESLDRLWTYHYEGAAFRYLNQWIDQLRWQRLEPFKKLAEMLLGHLEGILNYCRTPMHSALWKPSTATSKLSSAAGGDTRIYVTSIEGATAGGAEPNSSFSARQRRNGASSDSCAEAERGSAPNPRRGQRRELTPTGCTCPPRRRSSPRLRNAWSICAKKS